MIGMSPSFLRALSYPDLVQNSGNYVLFIFTGLEPTSTEIQAIRDMDSQGRVFLNNVLNWAQTRGDTFLQGRVFDSFEPVYPNNRLIQWQLADKTEEFFQVNEGNVGWFMYAKTDSTADISTYNIANINDPSAMTSECLYTLFGGCGDEEAEADLGIFSGFVDTDREYTMTDLEVAFI